MIPVIISGGSGTRLWPVSRENYPKQFCEFYDVSFLENSIKRLKPFGEPYALTVSSMETLTNRTFKKCDVSVDNAIYEPMGKNTAPAIAFLCHVLNQKGKASEVVGIFPSDHLVLNEAEFQKAVNLGKTCAEKGQVATLGILPKYAATGYGYIKTQDETLEKNENLQAHKVEGFREKPSHEKAQEYLNSGQYYWNAGMFIFKVSTMIEHFKVHLPDMWQRISTIKDDLSNAKHVYANLESISIDYGIMEKISDQVCIPCDIGWSDVGSWDEISRLADEMPSLRRDINAKVVTEQAQSNYVFSIRNKVVALLGVENLLVVDTPDALLISKKGKSQDVKKLVEKIKSEGLTQATNHLFEKRPWGGFEVLKEDKNFKSKSISVDPGARLSYQSHEKRSENWVIVEGEAEVTLNDEKHILKAGQSIFIPMGAKHRIMNPGKTLMRFIEVQTGTYFGEDDIVRYEDDYGRQ